MVEESLGGSERQSSERIQSPLVAIHTSNRLSYLERQEEAAATTQTHLLEVLRPTDAGEHSLDRQPLDCSPAHEVDESEGSQYTNYSEIDISDDNSGSQDANEGRRERRRRSITSITLSSDCEMLSESAEAEDPDHNTSDDSSSQDLFIEQIVPVTPNEVGDATTSTSATSVRTAPATIVSTSGTESLRQSVDPSDVGEAIRRLPWPQSVAGPSGSQSLRQPDGNPLYRSEFIVGGPHSAHRSHPFMALVARFPGDQEVPKGQAYLTKETNTEDQVVPIGPEPKIIPPDPERRHLAFLDIEVVQRLYAEQRRQERLKQQESACPRAASVLRNYLRQKKHQEQQQLQPQQESAQNPNEWRSFPSVASFLQTMRQQEILPEQAGQQQQLTTEEPSGEINVQNLSTVATQAGEPPELVSEDTHEIAAKRPRQELPDDTPLPAWKKWQPVSMTFGATLLSRKCYPFSEQQEPVEEPSSECPGCCQLLLEDQEAPRNEQFQERSLQSQTSVLSESQSERTNSVPMEGSDDRAVRESVLNQQEQQDGFQELSLRSSEHHNDEHSDQSERALSISEEEYHTNPQQIQEQGRDEQPTANYNSRGE